MVSSFQDLDVYKRLYAAMLTVMTKVIVKLPAHEKFDLADQMKRACKAPLAILAEGYAKKHYQKDWIKYINDAMGECNEMMVHLSICRDLYSKEVPKSMSDELIKEYDVSGKQLYRLAQSWKKNV